MNQKTAALLLWNQGVSDVPWIPLCSLGSQELIFMTYRAEKSEPEALETALPADGNAVDTGKRLTPGASRLFFIACSAKDCRPEALPPNPSTI